MLTIFDKSFESNLAFKDKLTYLNGTNQLSTFRTHDLRELNNVIAKIKFLLGSEPTRLQGLTLLKTVLVQCHHEIFCKNAFSWAHSAIEVLQSSDSYLCKNMACTVLNLIIANLSRFPSLKQDVKSNLFPSLIPVLLQTTIEDEWFPGTLKCLAICMQRFPSLLYQTKKDIEKFLLTHLDSLISPEVIAECFAALPFCSGQGTSAKMGQVWLGQFTKMLATLHTLLNDLLLDIENAGLKVSCEHLSEGEKLVLPVEIEEPFSYLMYQARAFSAISRCLAKMMSCKTLGTQQIPVDAVLKLVYRVLAVSAEDMFNVSSDEIQLVFSLLPDMRCSILTLLESLIMCGQTALVQKADFIGRIFVQSLKISKELHFTKSPFRLAAIKVLIVWLKRLGKKGSPEILKRQEIIFELLDDILPQEQNEIRTQSTEIQLKQTNQDAVSKQICGDSISLFYVEALKALITIVYTGGIAIEPSVLEDIHKRAVLILNKIQCGTSIPTAYCDARCRKKLYSLLLATVVASSPRSKHSLLYSSVRIFKLGLHDSSEQVSGVCNKAFTVLKQTLHPSRASPHLPVPVPPPPQVIRPVFAHVEKAEDQNHEWAVNGEVENIDIDEMSQHNLNESENEQFASREEYSPEEAGHSEECNGDAPQNSSHEDIESGEEESEEEIDEEGSEEEEMDEEIERISPEPENYVDCHPPSHSGNYSDQGPSNNFHKEEIETPSLINDTDCSKITKSLKKIICQADNSNVNDEEYSNNSLRIVNTGVNPSINSNFIQIVNSSAGHNINSIENINCNVYRNEDLSVHQNGMYHHGRPAMQGTRVCEISEVVSEAEFEKDIPSQLQKKRPLENSFESSAKKHAAIVEQESNEDFLHDDGQNAKDMLEDFISCSPDNSQS